MEKMMQIAAPHRTYTPEEYLDLEDQADFKSEYFDGAIVPMAGGTTSHNQISVNLSSELTIALKRQDYLLISQTQTSVTHYTRTAKKRWTIAVYDHDDLDFTFSTVPAQISLADLYNKVEF